MGSLGASWAHLGRALGASWSARRRLGAILGRVGAILECFGRIWEGFGGVLEAFWEHFWKIFCHLEQQVKIAKSQVLGGFPGLENLSKSIKIRSERLR